MLLSPALLYQEKIEVVMEEEKEEVKTQRAKCKS
jgi:hypothetical protein